MFLSRLTIKEGSAIVREVSFRRGLNLIVDETPKSGVSSGNNVGKSTLLRTIDFCLGGKAEPLYSDKEFADHRNDTVYDYLVKGDVVCELELEGEGGALLVERQLGKSPLVNGVQCSASELRTLLGKRLYGLSAGGPSFRQLAARLIRADDWEVSHAVHYLHPSAPKKVYEAIYLYMFGFRDADLLKRRKTIVATERKLQAQEKAVGQRARASGGSKFRTTAAARQALKILRRRVEAAVEHARALQVEEASQEELQELEDVRAEAVKIASRLSHIRTSIALQRRALQEIEDREPDVDLETLGALYEEATEVARGITVPFAAMVDFHRSLLVSKRDWLQHSIGVQQQKLDALEPSFRIVSGREQELLIQLADRDAFAGYEKVQRRAQELRAAASRLESLLSELEEIDQELARNRLEALEVAESISTHRVDIETRVGEFNAYFSDLTEQLYGESHYLVVEVNADTLSVSVDIDAIGHGEGTGKKRAQILAFDLAYLKLTRDCWPSQVRFSVQDRVEDVAEKQLKRILECSDESGSQVLVAVLREKLSSFDAKWVDERIVSSLSQEDKFLRLP